MITRSDLWKEIQKENKRLEALLKEHNVMSFNEMYRNSGTFDEFAAYFDDTDRAWELWNDLTLKYTQ